MSLNALAVVAILVVQASAFPFDFDVQISHDGPVVLGGVITFKAELKNDDGSEPSGDFRYTWSDNALRRHEYTTDSTENTTTYWSISYPQEHYSVGIYTVQVIVEKKVLFWMAATSRRVDFKVTTMLNGNMSVVQQNKTLASEYVASSTDTKIRLDIRQGDYELMKNATSLTTHWFIDCKYYGQTPDMTFDYKFLKPNETHSLEALVIASYEPPTTTTTQAPTTTTTQKTTTTTTSTPPPPNGTTVVTTTKSPTKTTTVTTTVKPKTTTGKTTTTAPSETIFGNVTFPYVCLNTSVVPPDPKKTYGYFGKIIQTRAAIKNISVEGTNWIQPWDTLNLHVACSGSGPFVKCLQIHRGTYNVTGNETCDDGDQLHNCSFSITRWFPEPSVYTIILVLENKVSMQVYPITVNIYKATVKPQLSVIVVPVGCSLFAIVLIIFGVAYYVQNKARFTIEVADFDFGRSNPDMEYKTFTERLRDSINSAGYKQLINPDQQR